jgi:hypothetical protein
MLTRRLYIYIKLTQQSNDNDINLFCESDAWKKYKIMYEFYMSENIDNEG